MRNKFLRYSVFFIVVTAFSSCIEDKIADSFKDKDATEELNVMTSINPSLDEKMARTVTVSEQQELLRSLNIVITNSSTGKIADYWRGEDELPSGSTTAKATFKLSPGNFLIEGWAGDSLSASFDKRFYKGKTTAEIVKGRASTATLACEIANVAVKTNFAKSLTEVLTDYSLTVGHMAGELIYSAPNGTIDKTGYFMMPKGDKNLSWSLAYTTWNGDSKEMKGVIENAVPGTLYTLSFSYTGENDQEGGALIHIKTYTLKNTDDMEFQVRTNPEIYLFKEVTENGVKKNIYADISNLVYEPVSSEELCEASMAILSSGDITSVELESDSFPKWGLPRNIDIFKMHVSGSDLLGNLKSHGIVSKDSVKNLSAMTSSFRILFDDAVKATVKVEDNGKEYELSIPKNLFNGNMTVKVKDVDLRHVIFPNQYPDADERTVKRQIVFTEKSEDTPSIDNPQESQPQIENAGFEDWFFYNDKIWVPGIDYTSNWWDSGNHGSTTMGASYNITTKDTSVKHSGSSSVKMESKYIVLKFAAGNVFLGKYLKTDGADGILGFGRPFSGKPKALKAWIKYEPGVVESKTAGDNLKPGDNDLGSIYVALADATVQEFEGTTWPVIIRTKKSDRQLFNKNASNILAYGEIDLKGSYPQSGASLVENGMQQVTIPIEYKNYSVSPSYIIIVASASKYGDYFEGGTGSTLWLDDVELVY